MRFSAESRENIRSGIIDLAEELSDIDYQHDVWVLRSRPGLIGSFYEARASLIDDYSVYDVLAQHADFNLSADQAAHLRRLAEGLTAFGKMFGCLKDREIIELPEWQGIIQLARTFASSVK
jgi:hypothetical protein